MRSAILPLLATIAMSVATPAPKTHLFILAGQSNMARMNPARTFNPAVEAAFPGDTCIVVKSALEAQPISRWFKGWKSASGERPAHTGRLYDTMLKTISDRMIARRADTVTFVWMQGERDATDGQGAVYGASLRGLIDQLKVDLDRNDLNFVIGRLSDFRNDPEKFPDWAEVRRAQVEIAQQDPRGAWVDTDDLNGATDRKHYTDQGYDELGSRFAKAAIGLILATDSNTGSVDR